MEIPAEPNLLKTIRAITHCTESAKEFPNVPSANESEGAPDAASNQGTALKHALSSL